MKKTFFVSLLILIVCSCTMDTESKKLSSFLQTFAVDIKSYKVICFVPADGCRSCIDPSIIYSKKADNRFLLVLSSPYTKSINFIVESYQIDLANIVSDNQNMAYKSQLISPTAPCFYFLNNGRIVKIVDLLKTDDKTSVLKEVDQFLLSQ